jgi:hypothetical protein
LGDENMRKTANLEKIIGDFYHSNAFQGMRNYLIDTSAKIASYAPVMAAMEACDGLDGKQILQSRLSAALVDTVVARAYGKTLDYVYHKFNANPHEGGIRNYLIDTVTMVGVYTPVYAGILCAAGASGHQIGTALLMGAGIAAITAKPYAKYILRPWRKLCKYKSKRFLPKQ